MTHDTNPLISIITVCFNAREGLETTVASVDSQTYEGFEHVIVDGASTDGTLAYLKHIKSPRRRTLSERDNGLYDAMNKSISLARAPYLHFLNAGDVYMEPESLALAAALLKDRPDLLSLRAENEFGELSTALDLIGQHSDSTGRMEAMLFKAETLNTAQFDPQYRIKADRDAILRMMLSKAKVVDREEVFVKIEAVGLSSTNIPRKERENVQITWRNIGLSTALAKSIAGAAARLALFYPTRWLGVDWNTVKRRLKR